MKKTISWKAELYCPACVKKTIKAYMSYNYEKKELGDITFLDQCSNCGYPKSNQSNKVSFDNHLYQVLFIQLKDFNLPPLFRSPDIEIHPEPSGSSGNHTDPNSPPSEPLPNTGYESSRSDCNSTKLGKGW